MTLRCCLRSAMTITQLLVGTNMYGLVEVSMASPALGPFGSSPVIHVPHQAFSPAGWDLMFGVKVFMPVEILCKLRRLVSRGGSIICCAHCA